MLLFLSILDIFQITSLTQPGKIDANFLSEVFSYMIQRLILVPLPPSSPVLIQNLTEVHVFRTNAMNWLLILTLHQNSNGKKKCRTWQSRRSPLTLNISDLELVSYMYMHILYPKALPRWIIGPDWAPGRKNMLLSDKWYMVNRWMDRRIEGQNDGTSRVET